MVVVVDWVGTVVLVLTMFNIGGVHDILLFCFHGSIVSFKKYLPDGIIQTVV